MPEKDKSSHATKRSFDSYQLKWRFLQGIPDFPATWLLPIGTRYNKSMLLGYPRTNSGN